MSALATVVAGALLAASHDGRLHGDSLEWRTTFVADGEAVERIDFAAPIPRETEIVLPDGIWTIAGATGDVVALSTPLDAWREQGRRQVLSIAIRQRVSPEDAVRVAPVVAGGAVQRVTLTAGGGAVRFVPDASLGIEQHLAYASSRGVTEDARVRCDDLLSGIESSSSPATWTAYLAADRALLEHGLTGTIHTGRPSRRAALTVAGGFAALVVVLAALHRALDRRARDERDEAVFQKEVERMRTSSRDLVT